MGVRVGRGWGGGESGMGVRVGRGWGRGKSGMGVQYVHSV